MNAVYTTFLAVSMGILLGFCAWILFRVLRKSGSKDALLSPIQLLALGCAISIFFIFVPIYFHSYFEGESLSLVRGVKTFFLAIHNTLRVFILDGDFDNIRDAAAELSGALPVVYTIFSAILYVFAPILTAGVVLSFFRGFFAIVKYHASKDADLFFISELNDDSFYLAKNIMEGGPLSDDIIAELEAKKQGKPLPEIKQRKRLVIFFDVYEQNEEANTELISRARELGAIFFRRDITELTPHLPKKGAKRKFYFIGENEDENLQQCLTVLHGLKKNEAFNTDATQLYVFSSTIESEMLLNNACPENMQMKVRRINENRNLIIDTLLTDSVFDHAIPTGKILPDGTEEKLLSILIVGLGRYGTELLKALSWSAQMIGYRLKIHVVDKDPMREKRFRMQCPEIMEISDRIKANGAPIPGESDHEIHFYTGVDIDTVDFYDTLDKIGPVTSVYCTLGQDEINIETAVYLRIYYGRRVQKNGSENVPAISAVVYSAEKNEALCSSLADGMDDTRHPALCDTQGNDYGIRFIGNRRLRYTMRIIEQPTLEYWALQCHLNWGDTPEMRAIFNRFEYNRRSSVANAVHKRLRMRLGYYFKGEEGKPEEEIAAIRAYNYALADLEHRRWNAFVRSEGYVAPNPTRNNLGELVPLDDNGVPVWKQVAKSDMIKVHRCLIPFEDLPLSEKEKDYIVNQDEEHEDDGASDAE
jgi:hypothetical protein